MAKYDNPFEHLAELLRGLKQRFVAEAGLLDDATLMSPQTGEILGGIAGLINDSELLRRQLKILQRTEPNVYDAFQRALNRE